MPELVLFLVNHAKVVLLSFYNVFYIFKDVLSRCSPPFSFGGILQGLDEAYMRLKNVGKYLVGETWLEKVKLGWVLRKVKALCFLFNM